MTGRRGLLALIVLSAFVAGCAPRSETDAFVGYVEAEYVYVASADAGWIVETPVKEGDQVSSGDLLFALDDDLQRAAFAEAKGRAEQARAQSRDLETGARPAEIKALEMQWNEARASLALAEAERNRWMPLVREGNATRAKGDQVTADYNAALARANSAHESIEIAKLAGRNDTQDAARAAVAAAEAQVSQAQWRLDQRRTKARVSGRIDQMFHRRGEFVGAGAPVLSVLPDDALKVRFFIPQSALHGINVGDSVRVSADAAPDAINATVSFIADEAEFTPPVIYSTDSREKLVFLVEARLPPDAGLRPGLPVDVHAP